MSALGPLGCGARESEDAAEQSLQALVFDGPANGRARVPGSLELLEGHDSVWLSEFDQRLQAAVPTTA